MEHNDHCSYHERRGRFDIRWMLPTVYPVCGDVIVVLERRKPIALCNSKSQLVVGILVANSL